MHIVVTGASSGIGRAIAKAFDRPTNVVSLVARRGALLSSLASEMKARTHVIEADLGDGRDPIAWVRRAESLAGPIDILVNNAGTSYVEPAVGVEPERVRSIFQINVDTPIAATQYVLPAMLARRAGIIVQVASNAAFSPAPGFAHYTATKGALANYSESLRVEVARSGVHVLTVYPGPVHTPMGDRNWAQFESASAKKMAPIGDADTLARLIVAAVERRRARVIYPSFYKLGWYFPWLGRWIASNLVPPSKGTRTPPLEGDRVRTEASAHM